jgi:hypothetical protein
MRNLAYVKWMESGFPVPQNEQLWKTGQAKNCLHILNEKIKRKISALMGRPGALCHL